MQRRHFLLMTTALGGSLVLPREALACGEACEAAQSGGTGAPRLPRRRKRTSRQRHGTAYYARLAVMHARNAADFFVLYLIFRALERGMFPGMDALARQMLMAYSMLLGMGFVAPFGLPAAPAPASDIEDILTGSDAEKLKQGRKKSLALREKLRKDRALIARKSREFKRLHDKELSRARKAGGKVDPAKVKAEARKKAAPALSRIARMRQKLKRLDAKEKALVEKLKTLRKSLRQLENEQKALQREARSAWRELGGTRKGFESRFLKSGGRVLPKKMKRFSDADQGYRHELVNELRNYPQRLKRLRERRRDLVNRIRRTAYRQYATTMEAFNLHNEIELLAEEEARKARNKIKARYSSTPGARDPQTENVISLSLKVSF